MGSGYAGIEEEEEEEAVPQTPRSPTSPGRFGGDRAQQSLDDLAAFFQAAITELRNPHPVEVARKLRERVKSVTEVHIHRDKKKAAEFETIDYMPQDSEMYRKWLHTQPLQRLWDRWLMMFLVGIVVGLCAFCLHVCFHTLASWKARAAASYQCSARAPHRRPCHRTRACRRGGAQPPFVVPGPAASCAPRSARPPR